MNKKTKEEYSQKNDSIVLSRLRSGLRKTRNSLAATLDNMIHGTVKLGPELLSELEEALLIADVGINTTNTILVQLRKEVSKNRLRTHKEVLNRLKGLLVEMLGDCTIKWTTQENEPLVILVIGINGSGKTTTIGKLAQKWKAEGQDVIIAAGDTFRAGAGEQLQVWADRAGVTCVRQKTGADPSAVAYDAVQAGVARKVDIVLIDTAGRLQTNINLMEELKKIKRVIGKVLPNAPHKTLLVLDASIGQNSFSQAKSFNEAMKIDGLIMTKLDGTSKGGILFYVSRELNIPIYFIGIGETSEDLHVFSPKEFVHSLFEN